MSANSGFSASNLKWILMAVCAAAVFAPASASAQATNNPEIDVQNFRPAVGPHSIFTLESADTIEHLRPTGGMMLNYASQPLVSDPPDGPATAIIDQQLALHLFAGFGLFDQVQLDLEMPVYAVNDGVFGQNSIEGARLGDLSFRPKYMLMSSTDGPVGLGTQLDLTLPTGDADSFVGYPGVQFTPSIIADTRLSNLLLAANVGVKIRKNQDVRNLELGERLEYGIGAKADFVDGLLSIGGELFGSTELRNAFGSSNTSPLEGILGATINTPSGFAVTAGAGGGFVGGYGSPEFRGFIGLSYATLDSDSDEDGINDDVDECDSFAEDYDGFEDEDGCPDEDNDGDGLADLNDRCPNQAGEASEEGCPKTEPDDTDEDGIVDEEDDCPEKAEDKDGFEDEDGCPDEDNDQDGVLDADDDCAEEKEDRDGFEDEDGCPDADNDLDGLTDANDDCPNEAGLESNKGCPAEEKKVVMGEDAIEILEKVFFESDKAVIKEQSFSLLREVGLVLRTNPNLEKVEIQGHTDSRGSAEYNRQLSQDRANAVRTFLIEEMGIDADRLVAKGYGEDDLLDESGTAEARTKNRRVEFEILERKAGGEEAGEEEAGEEEAGEEEAGEEEAGEEEAGEEEAGEEEAGEEEAGEEEAGEEEAGEEEAGEEEAGEEEAGEEEAGEEEAGTQ